MAAAVGPITAQMTALSIEATPTPSVGELWGRVVSPYLGVLKNALPTMDPPELHALIASYLSPRDPTEVLLQATFADFIEPGESQNEARVAARIWAPLVPTMDYSRVFMMINCGALPLITYGDNGEMQPKEGPAIPFRGRNEGIDIQSIPLQDTVFPDLLARAHRVYFAHAKTVVNPHGYCMHGSVMKLPAAATTGARPAGRGAARLDECVTIQDPVGDLRSEGDEQRIRGTASKIQPVYMVTLRLQSVVGMDAAPQLDEKRAPLLCIERHVGVRRYEGLVSHEIQELPVDLVGERNALPPVE